MIEIKEDCREQAANMVRTQGTLITICNDMSVYALDGKAWVSTQGTVFRSDDHVETDIIFQLANKVKV